MIIFGIIFFIWGIVAFINNRKFSNIKPVRGVVTSCEKKDSDVWGTGMQYFETKIEFTSSYGTLHRTVNGEQPYVVGTNLDVRFDAKRNKIMLERTYKKKGKVYPIVFAIMGLVTMVIDIVLMVSKVYSMDLVTKIIGMGILGIFMLVGIWLSFIRPFNRRRFIKKCDIVDGELVDFVRAGYSSSKGHNRHDYNYAAIYEYTYGGVKQLFRSSASGNGGSHTQYGRKVSIAVNNDTGEVMCLEDEKGSAVAGIVFMLFAIGFAFAIYKFDMF